MHRLIIRCWIALGLCLTFGVAFAHAADHRLQVVATFSIIGDMTSHIAGDLADVRVLVGRDIDAHDYEPMPSDAKAIKHADMLIANGLGFDPWISRLMRAAEFKGKLVIATQSIAPITLSVFGKPLPDPHAWQDISLGIVYINNIARALADADPANASTYRANADEYASTLQAMDKNIKDSLAVIPQSRRQVLTNHSAFGYFGRAYGVTFIGLNGLSADSELSAKSLHVLIEQIRKSGIKTMFIEHLSDPRLLEQVAKETGAKDGGTLFSDSLAHPGLAGDSYLGMFTNNLEKLVSAMSDHNFGALK